MLNGPLFQEDDSDSGSPGQAAGAAADSFPDSTPGAVAPCPATSSPNGDQSGTLTVPDVTVVGDPEISKAYATGYQDGVSGLQTDRGQYEWPGDRDQTWSSDDEQNYQTAYDKGFSDGQYNAEPPQESSFPSAGNAPPEEPEWEQFDEQAEYPDVERTRYLELKMKAARLRRLRFFGKAGPEDELTEEEREEYAELYDKFGATDPDPEALPPPPQAEQDEGEGEGEAE